MRCRVRFQLRRAFRWVGIYALLPAAVLLALRLVWGWEANRRLGRARATLLALDELQLGGAPGVKSPLDFFHELLVRHPADQNERDFLMGTDREGILETRWTAEDEARIRGIVASYGPEFDHLDALANEWPERLAVLNFTGDQLAEVGFVQIETLHAALFHGAREAFQTNDEALGLRRLREVIFVSHVAARIPTMGGEVLSYRRMFAQDCVEKFGPSLELADPVARSEASRLIAVLLDGDELSSLGAHGWLQGSLDLERYAQEGKFVDPFKSWWLRPLILDSVSRMMEHGAAVQPAFLAKDYQEAKPRLTAFERAYRGNATELSNTLNGIELSVSGEAMGPGPAVVLNDRAETACRAAAFLLAARLYATQIGHYPTSAADLLPQFLPEIPVDPFARSGRLMYRLDPGGPTVWSVGEDGIDDGGNAVAVDSDGKPKNRFNHQKDAIFGARWRAAEPPASLSAPAAP